MPLTFNRSLADFKPPGNGWCTASALGTSIGCQRSLLIDNYFRHNGMYASVHLKFGSALGDACTTLVRHYTSPRNLRLAHAYDAARKHLRASERLDGKDWSKLWRALCMFDAQWAFMHKDGWRYHSSEVRRAISIEQPDGSAPHILSGAYDLKLVKGAGAAVTHLMLDFKAFYSFEHDTQVPIYMLLDAIHEVANGRSIPRFALPEYFVFEVGKDDTKLKLSRVCVSPSAFLTSLEGSIATHAEATRSAAYITSAIKHGVLKDAVDALRRIPINVSACQRGTFKCFQYPQCHEGVPVNFAEPRLTEAQHALVPTVSLTYSEVLEIIDALAGSLAGINSSAPASCPAFEGDGGFDLSLFM